MSHHSLHRFIAFVCFHCTITLFATTPPSGQPVATTLKFNGTDYLLRWSQAGQFEFTPQGQENLERWTDMLTLNYYPQATTGEGLAGIANAVIGNYKKANGMIVRTNSVPRTPEKEAEHFLTVLFPRPEFIEAVFVRLKLAHGMGSAVIYSHRIYGKKIGHEASAWLSAHGPSLEKAIMIWESLPPLHPPAK